MENKLKFEEAIKQLGDIVKSLENGDVALDDAITLYEQGMKLSKYCAELLETAEQKVRFLQEQAGQSGNES